MQKAMWEGGIILGGTSDLEWKRPCTPKHLHHYELPRRAGPARTAESLKCSACVQKATWEGGMTMGGTFDLEWKRAYGLRWEEVAHLRNPLNEDKPVKISRDGQELPPELGHQLLVMIEEGADREGIPRPAAPGAAFGHSH